MTAPTNHKRRAFRNNRDALLKWSRNANAAKARKRMESYPPDYEPKMEAWCRFEFKVRDRLTGEISEWHDLVSARQMSQQANRLLKYYH